MNTIHPYTPDIELGNFPALLGQLSNDFHIITDNYIELTPRYWIYKSVAFKNIFYYIDLIYTNSPETIIDIGCGECIWKDYYPNIIGLDTLQTEHSNEDINDYFDEQFSGSHSGHYSCGIALGSLHFNKWEDLSNVIENAMNVVTDRFLFTFNFDRLDEHSKESAIQFNTSQEKVQYIEKTLTDLPYKVVMLDYAELDKTDMYHTFEQMCNGHVRFILEH